MKIIELYFVRHGDYNKNSGHLNESGIEQLVNAGKEIKKQLPELKRVIIYSSPQIRAKESAEIIKKTLYPEIDSTISVNGMLDCEEYKIRDLVQKISEDSIDCAILVSHKPDLEAYLNYPFSKGEVVHKRIEVK